jgi:long-chain acyl-CoA synthetase
MNSVPNFNQYIEQSIKTNWEKDALTDYKGATLQFHDVARKIEKLHIMFENSGVKKGDKIALCGRNSSNWAVAFLATLTYGAVAVPIQNEFKAEQIYNIVNHSESKLLFVGDVVATQINYDEMPTLEGIIYIPDNSLILSRSEKLTYAREHLNEIFGKKYPKYFRKEHVNYHQDSPEELAMINYTSGTTGFSKGVMLPYRTLASNYDFLSVAVGAKLPENCDVLAILPMAHMYGLSCEFILEFCLGNHIYFLTRLPSPTVIQQAFMDIHPAIIVSVPLVIEKIIRKNVFPKIQTNIMKLLMSMPVINKKVKEKILEIVKAEFGGNMYEVIVGGAGLNKEIEDFLLSIGFPLTMGYGTTETAPMITYSDWHDFVGGSCGTAAKNMEVKIVSEDPENIPGEIITRGLNVMTGYYKNQEATNAVIDDNGWFHTGDLATMNAEGHVFIRGRKKNMLLGANGQNIYPEEIENKLNSMAMVNESLIIQREERLVGLVHPDYEEADSMGFSSEDLENIMEQNRKELNAMLPTFAKISVIKLLEEEFAKTPKKSIKRYLYQDAI